MAGSPVIVEWLGSLWVGLVGWFTSLFGTDPVPGWMLDAGDMIQSLITGASGLGVWVPWVLAITVATFVGGLWLVAVAIKFIRWVLGWIPTMGGS